MARYPGARWRPLPENAGAAGIPREPLITVTQVVLHTAVGESSPWGYFARASTLVESHLWVGRSTVEQYVDTARQADAQAAGNAHAISVESADNGHPDRDPWTDWQVDQLAAICAWAHRQHGVPLRACRTATDPGIGYHRQFEQWNPNAHSCPGDARVRQVPEVIRRARLLVATPAAGGQPAPTVGGGTGPVVEDDVRLDDKITLGKYGARDVGFGDSTIGVGEALALAARGGQASLAIVPVVARLAADVAVLRAAVTATGPISDAQLRAAGEAGAEAFARALGDAITGTT